MQKRKRAGKVLPGVMVPVHLAKLKRKAGYLAITPLLAFAGYGNFRLAFDFRLFTSVDEMPSDEPIFALRNDLLSDIQTKLSGHVSRLGVASTGS